MFMKEIYKGERRKRNLNIQKNNTYTLNPLKGLTGNVSPMDQLSELNDYTKYKQ